MKLIDSTSGDMAKMGGVREGQTRGAMTLYDLHVLLTVLRLKIG